MSDVLREFVRAVALMDEPLASLVHDERGAWSALADPDRIPVEGLPWLAQFVGVRVTRGASPERQRAEIRAAAGLRRGRPAAIREAVAATLTGSRTVRLLERYGSAYRLRVETLAVETPDPAATEAAALSQKPAGIVLEFATVVGPTWDDASDDTWDDAADGTWDDDTAFD